MRRAWVVLLAGCGFHSQALPTGEPDAAPTDAVVVVDIPDGATCWRLDGTNIIHVLACTTQTIANVDITGNVDINTDTGASIPAGYACAPLAGGNEPLCAIIGDKVTVSGKVVAHGSKPFAILAHELELRGAIDVAGHLGGVPGAGAITEGCNFNDHDALKSGGGAGGGFGSSGGKGGDEGGQPASGAPGGNSIGDSFRGGCTGTGGGNGSDSGQPRGPGGPGGGAVWLAADLRPLTIADSASINASGGGGAGGAIPSYGGSGGGSGGLIVLQAQTITRDSAQIFANGGHGGGGAAVDDPGQDGGDPERATSGGTDGHGGGHGPPATRAGDGGIGVGLTGIPGPANEGKPGGDPDTGGGGGGGGVGRIWLASASSLGTSNISPTPRAVP